MVMLSSEMTKVFALGLNGSTLKDFLSLDNEK
jgi:hypothetical protein